MSRRFRRPAAAAAMLFFFSFSTMTACTPSGTEERGQGLYLDHCARCHGPEGKGFRSLYPSLYDSPFFSSRRSTLPCIIRHGIRSAITPEGGNARRAMPANSLLSMDDIRDLMMYTIRFSQKPAEEEHITPEMIEKWLQNCP